MTRQLISSGSTFEAQIGYSRAVVAGDWIFVSGTTGFEDGESDEYDLEPPVPPGLKKLSPALRNFVQVFDIDPFLVQAATEASPDLQNPLTIDYRDLISRLPRSECDGYLIRLADGDAGVRLSLRKRLSEFLPKETAKTAKPRPLQQMAPLKKG